MSADTASGCRLATRLCSNVYMRATVNINPYCTKPRKEKTLVSLISPPCGRRNAPESPHDLSLSVRRPHVPPRSGACHSVVCPASPCCTVCESLCSRLHKYQPPVASSTRAMTQPTTIPAIAPPLMCLGSACGSPNTRPSRVSVQPLAGLVKAPGPLGLAYMSVTMRS